MIPDEHRQFLESHNVCVVGFARKSGPPSLSPVYYYLDGDEIVFSTTKTRGKGRAVARSPEITVCVIDTSPPYPYLTVFGRARVDEEGALEANLKAVEIITGSPVNDAMRPFFEQRAKEEGRVAIRVTPVGYFKTQPIPHSQRTAPPKG
jgi:PPOX class probable F420-dependent enzyme